MLQALFLNFPVAKVSGTPGLWLVTVAKNKGSYFRIFSRSRENIPLYDPSICYLKTLPFLNGSYSTLFRDSTISIFFNLKYITALTKQEKATVRRKP